MAGLDAVLAEAPEHHKALVYRGLLSLREDPATAVKMFERAAAVEDSPQLQAALAEARTLAAGGTVRPPMGQPAAPSGKPVEVLAKGRITLADGADATAGKVLFVALRPAPGVPPVASVKLPPGPFPMDFEVTTANVLPMAGNRPLPESFLVVARLDSDGNAFTKPDTDPAIEVPGVTKGAEGLEITLQ
jgi:hypothetical protein